MKLRRMLLTAAALSLAVLSGGLFSVQADASDSAGTINKGVYLGGVDVSGMTVEEASRAVEAKVAEMGNTKVTLRVADKQLDTTAAELGLTWENKSVVNEAAGLGKSGNLIKRYKDNKDLENETKKKRKKGIFKQGQRDDSARKSKSTRHTILTVLVGTKNTGEKPDMVAHFSTSRIPMVAKQEALP